MALLRAQKDQFEALGLSRRARVSEDDYKANTRATPRASELEADRRINQRGTEESRVSDNIRGKLSVWSSAWTVLANDDAARDNLPDINAGQTHRASLATSLSSEPFSQSARSAGVDRVNGRARGGGRGRGRGLSAGQTRRANLDLSLSDEPFTSGTRSPAVGRVSDSARGGGRGRGLSARLLDTGVRRRHGPTRVPVGVRRTPTVEIDGPASLADPDTFMAAAMSRCRITMPPTTTASPTPIPTATTVASMVSPASDEDLIVLESHDDDDHQAVPSSTSDEDSEAGSLQDSQPEIDPPVSEVLVAQLPSNPLPTFMKQSAGAIFGEHVFQNRFLQKPIIETSTRLGNAEPPVQPRSAIISW